MASALRTVERDDPYVQLSQTTEKGHQRASWRGSIRLEPRSGERIWIGWQEGHSVSKIAEGAIPRLFGWRPGYGGWGRTLWLERWVAASLSCPDVWLWTLSLIRCAQKILISHRSPKGTENSGKEQGLRPQGHFFPGLITSSLSCLTWKMKKNNSSFFLVLIGKLSKLIHLCTNTY